MENKRTLMRAIGELWRTLAPRRRRQFYVLVFIMIAASVAEIFSLGMIVPFLAVLTSPDRVLAYPLVQTALGWVGPLTTDQLVLWVAISFCFATLLAACVRLLLLYASSGFSFALGADLSLEIYRRTLYQPYPAHISRNSTEVISGVVGKANDVSANILGQLLTISSAIILMIGIVGALFAISPIVTLSAIAAFIIIYGGIIWMTRVRLRRDSRIVSESSPQVLKALQEGLGGIRDVLIDGTQETFTEIYRAADRKVRSAQGRILLTVGSPRFLVEGLGMIFIALIAVGASRGGADANVVPVLGALALGAQRLLPVAQQTYASLIAIRGSEAALWDVLGLLRQPLPEALTDGRASVPLAFERELRLSNVSFSYGQGGLTVLDGVDLVIEKGSRVGIFGPTGGGKSTLLDIMMGLLEPTSGTLTVDGAAIDGATRRSWQAHISHVPQSIYLSDASISENIAFGRRASEIDQPRVAEAAALAQIAPTIDSWPAGYATFVGERGIRLSGGQRQRIGVARALYKRADVIIFDEATSALDTGTERDLMSAIDGLSRDLTIIMVAHRLSTLKGCDLLLEVTGAGVRSVDPATALEDS